MVKFYNLLPSADYPAASFKIPIKNIEILDYDGKYGNCVSIYAYNHLYEMVMTSTQIEDLRILKHCTKPSHSIFQNIHYYEPPKIEYPIPYRAEKDDRSFYTKTYEIFNLGRIVILPPLEENVTPNNFKELSQGNCKKNLNLSTQINELEDYLDILKTDHLVMQEWENRPYSVEKGTQKNILRKEIVDIGDKIKKIGKILTEYTPIKYVHNYSDAHESRQIFGEDPTYKNELINTKEGKEFLKFITVKPYLYVSPPFTDHLNETFNSTQDPSDHYALLRDMNIPLYEFSPSMWEVDYWDVPIGGEVGLQRPYDEEY